MKGSAKSVRVRFLIRRHKVFRSRRVSEVAAVWIAARSYPPRAAIIAERLTLVAAVRGMVSTNSTVLGAL